MHRKYACASERARENPKGKHSKTIFFKTNMSYNSHIFSFTSTHYLLHIYQEQGQKYLCKPEQENGFVQANYMGTFSLIQSPNTKLQYIL